MGWDEQEFHMMEQRLFAIEKTLRKELRRLVTAVLWVEDRRFRDQLRRGETEQALKERGLEVPD